MIPVAALSVVRAAAPYLIAAGVGFGGAWWLQGLRVTAVEQEFTQYRQDQVEAKQKADEAAEKRRTQQEKDYAVERQKLVTQIEAGDAYRRCVAAGKCGVRVVSSCPTSGNGISTPGLAYGTGTDPIPVTPGTTPTTGEGDPVIGECAATTLMLNQLQEAIESQPGF